jgi:hypothetical protein
MQQNMLKYGDEVCIYTHGEHRKATITALRVTDPDSGRAGNVKLKVNVPDLENPDEMKEIEYTWKARDISGFWREWEAEVQRAKINRAWVQEEQERKDCNQQQIKAVIKNVAEKLDTTITFTTYPANSIRFNSEQDIWEFFLLVAKKIKAELPDVDVVNWTEITRPEVS